MPENESKIGSPFDVQTVRQLVALMSRHDLSEIDLREGAVRIRLRRGPNSVPSIASIPVAATPSAPAPQTPALPTVPTDNGAKPAKAYHEIKSPTPGTFYASSSPDADPFVRVGSRVEQTSIVCLIEAMKIFNEIAAECNGVITEILVENQQPVEYGQVLFRVDPTA